MPWIALAAMTWGVVLGATAGPAVGAAVIALGLALLVLRGVADARRRRRLRAALIEATAAGRPAPLPVAVDPAPAAHDAPAVLRRPPFRETDDLDLALLNAFWNFGSVGDAATLTGCDAAEAQRRIVELVLEPRTAVPLPACPDRPLADFEVRALVRGWNEGQSLAALSAASGVSVFGVGGALLAAGPVPVGRVAEV